MEDNARKAMKLQENVARKLDDISRKMGGGSVSIGFQDGALYPDGTPVAAVAFWNEFGHEGQFPAPPRPFFRNMIEEHQKEWPEEMARGARATDYDGPKVLGRLGELVKGQLIQSINEFTTPGLSPVTIARKGFAKPLVDTGHMKDSITVKVDA